MRADACASIMMRLPPTRGQDRASKRPQGQPHQLALVEPGHSLIQPLAIGGSGWSDDLAEATDFPRELRNEPTRPSLLRVVGELLTDAVGILARCRTGAPCNAGKDGAGEGEAGEKFTSTHSDFLLDESLPFHTQCRQAYWLPGFCTNRE